MFGFFARKPFDPVRDKDAYDLSSKVVLITGANSGLGRAQAKYIAGYKPAKLYVGARSAERAAAAIEEIKEAVPGANVEFLEMDLSRLASVAAAAAKVTAANDRLDLLVNNAGVMALPAGRTADGYEIQFGTNHLGHFLLTRQLLPLLVRTAARPGSDVRVVTLSSEGEKLFATARGWDPALVTTDMAGANTFQRYGQSKLANVLFAAELARRHPALTSVAVHPGAVHTNLAGDFRKQHPVLDALLTLITPLAPLLVASPDTGAWNQTWASVAPLATAAEPNEGGGPRVVQGEFYHPVAVTGKGSAHSRNAALARELWEWSEAEVVRHGY